MDSPHRHAAPGHPGRPRMAKSSTVLDNEPPDRAGPRRSLRSPSPMCHRAVLEELPAEGSLGSLIRRDAARGIVKNERPFDLLRGQQCTMMTARRHVIHECSGILQ
eukprot:scaffold4020_cov391-Prasinococcus_capsulatus_cf.AAC.1